MSALPSPLKSPTLTSTQVAMVLHVSQRELVKPEPLDRATHHWPPSAYRPMISALPLPSKSPTCTPTQEAKVLQVVHLLVVKPPEPLDNEIHQSPVSLARPARS